MNSKKFFDWCRTAVSSIKHWPQKDDIHKDLYNHLEDRYAALREKGYTHEESEDKALSSMGDPNEVAKQLAKTYKPFWPMLLVATRCVMVIALIFSICFVYTKLSMKDIISASFISLMNEEDMSFTLKQNESCYSDGYTFTIKHVSYRVRDRGRAVNELWLDFVISHQHIWLTKPDLEKAFWAVDSEGTLYVNDSSRPENEKQYVHVRVNDQHTGLCEYTKSIVIHNVPAERLEWVELHYDRDGRELVWRIDLPGGDEQ